MKNNIVTFAQNMFRCVTNYSSDIDSVVSELVVHHLYTMLDSVRSFIALMPL